ncbi:hypothetical protein BD777DRAFT_138202 [Yarrowia lipolytica]|nr:hypothetical protein BD777DRAFT_138202 [Yarrowia lipolytica]
MNDYAIIAGDYRQGCLVTQPSSNIHRRLHFQQFATTPQITHNLKTDSYDDRLVCQGGHPGSLAATATDFLSASDALPLALLVISQLTKLFHSSTEARIRVNTTRVMDAGGKHEKIDTAPSHKLVHHRTDIYKYHTSLLTDAAFLEHYNS